MDSPLSKKAKTISTTFLVVSALFVAIVLGLYLANFAGSSGFSLSSSNQDWAQFGDFLAGTLGTVFSLLAFFGVLCTVWLQATQLDLASKQAALDEIQRVLATVSTRLDGLLETPVNHQFDSHALRAKPASFFRVLSSGGSAFLSLPTPDWMRQVQLEQLVAECKTALAPQSGIIGIELDQFAWLVNRYREQGGAVPVIDFYKRRYNAAVCWFDALGFANAHPHLQREFAPETIRESLTESRQ